MSLGTVGLLPAISGHSAIKIAAEESAGTWNDRPQFQRFKHLTGGANGCRRDGQSEHVFNNRDCAKGRHLNASRKNHGFGTVDVQPFDIRN